MESTSFYQDDIVSPKLAKQKKAKITTLRLGFATIIVILLILITINHIYNVCVKNIDTFVENQQIELENYDQNDEGQNLNEILTQNPNELLSQKFNSSKYNFKTGDVIFSIVNPKVLTDVDFSKQLVYVLFANLCSYYTHINIVIVHPFTKKVYIINSNYFDYYCEINKKKKSGIQMIDLDNYFNGYKGIGIYFPSHITLSNEQDEAVWNKCVGLCQSSITYTNNFTSCKMWLKMMINRHLLNKNYLECDEMICSTLAAEILRYIYEINPEFSSLIVPKTKEEIMDYGLIIKTDFHPYCVGMKELAFLCQYRFVEPILIHDNYDF